VRRWVQYVMPVMVELDDERDRITRIMALPDGSARTMTCAAMS